MSPRIHDRVSELFLTARELNGEEREEYLHEACAGDTQLRAEVESLLAYDGPTREISDAARRMPLPKARTPLTEDSRLGRFRIIRLLGEGGMGFVYEAEEVDSTRRVALKTISPLLPSAAMEESFVQEGRLAASVSHPHAVYVFGSEEIDGTLLLSMELMPGGTLADEVKSEGPLPVSRAVNAALQVISGLEAIQAAGILHRDVKPSNCFVDADGRIKLGDFGISIAGRHRGLSGGPTSRGVAVGTPSFASPEQLRGEDGDVRSDIYSVGATLYYLLTGRPPLDRGETIASIAGTSPPKIPRPRSLRPEISRGLERLVLRCLNEVPAKRFATYRELRESLRRLEGAGPRPAGWGPRFLAWMIDSLLLTFVLGLTVGLRSDPEGGPALLKAGIVLLAVLLYFAATEARWGASIGKAALGLRVVGSEGKPPGFRWTLARAAVPGSLLSLCWLPPFPIVTIACWVGLAALHATARARNGWASIHDLLSHTRVRVAPASVRRRKVDPEAAPAFAPPANVESLARIGPYLVLERARGNEGGSLLVAYDPKLQRRVWIRDWGGGEPELLQNRRDLRRPTRLRWLAGSRGRDASWDAFEAPAGQPLLDTRRSWREVRSWLLDLSEEATAGLEDQTLPPELDLRHVWITTDGRAKLLDFPAPGTGGPDPSQVVWRPEDFGSVQRVLCEVARLGLGSSRPRDRQEPRGFPSTVPLPLSARYLLQDLCAGAVADSASLTNRLRELVAAEPEVTRAQRLRHLSIMSIPAALALSSDLLIMIGFLLLEKRTIPLGAFHVLTATPVVALFAQSLVALPLAFLFRGGVVMRLVGVDVVTSDGAPASRTRCLLRAAAGWWCVWAMATILLSTGPLPLAILVPGYVAGAVWFASRALRLPQDRIAGTFLVPGAGGASAGAGAASRRIQTGRLERFSAGQHRPGLWVPTAIVVAGFLGLAGIVLATHDLARPEVEVRDLSHNLSSLSGDAHGRLLLDLASGEHAIEPGLARAPLRVEAAYDANHFEIEETWSPRDGSGWDQRVVLRRTSRGLRNFLTGDPNQVRVVLPRGVPIRLVGSFHEGASVRLELGGLWVPEAELSMVQGSFSLGFGQPLTSPMEHLVVRGGSGGFEIVSLGNASPETATIEFAWGGGRVDLRGNWVRDTDLRITCGGAGITVVVPETGAVEGLDSSRILRRGTIAVRTPSATLRIHNSSDDCSVNFPEPSAAPL